MCNVVLTDLRKFGVAVPAGLAVVSRPVRVGGHFAKAAPGTAQQEYAVVSGAQLQVVKTLAEDVSFDGLAFRGLNLQLLTARRTGCGAMLNRTQKIQQLRHFRTWDAAWRHASCGQAVSDQTPQLPVVVCVQTQPNWWADVTAVAVCPVASGAAGLESLAPDIDGFDILYGQPRNYHKEPRQHGSQIRSNCLMGWRSLMMRIMRCSVSSIYEIGRASC